jgi:carboxyl-terminal processing protease
MRINLIYRALLFTAVAFMVFSCEEIIVGKNINDSPVNNFELMWRQYDSHYGLFLVKNINWDSIYATHLPLAQAARNNEELYPVLTSMLENLKDKHVTIYPVNSPLPNYDGGYNGAKPAQEDFLFSLVETGYLTEYHLLNEDIGYGILPSNIGYIHFSAFKDEMKIVKKHVDKIMNALENTIGIVVDIRDHSGGSDGISTYIAGRFAKGKNLFMTSKKRNGPKHSDFEKTLQWFVEPTGSKQYTKPVVLLTTPNTISAGETFTLAMRANENVIHVGGTTAGAFSDEVFFDLANGWIYSVSVGDYRASDGKSYEGKGITPMIVSENKKADLLQGRDVALEKGISLLK